MQCTDVNYARYCILVPTSRVVPEETFLDRFHFSRCEVNNIRLNFTKNMSQTVSRSVFIGSYYIHASLVLGRSDVSINVASCKYCQVISVKSQGI